MGGHDISHSSCYVGRTLEGEPKRENHLQTVWKAFYSKKKALPNYKQMALAALFIGEKTGEEKDAAIKSFTTGIQTHSVTIPPEHWQDHYPILPGNYQWGTAWDSHLVSAEQLTHLKKHGLTIEYDDVKAVTRRNVWGEELGSKLEKFRAQSIRMENEFHKNRVGQMTVMKIVFITGILAIVGKWIIVREREQYRQMKKYAFRANDPSVQTESKDVETERFKQYWVQSALKTQAEANGEESE
jgi:hypothetical protein